MNQIAHDLMTALPRYTFKRGYFLLSTKGTGKYWLDLYGLSHLFNASDKADEYKKFLGNMIDKIIRHQIDNVKINSVIVPRWTRCTEDLFTETLLNICYDLFRIKYKNEYPNLRLFELFSAGGNTEEYYLNKVYPLLGEREQSEQCPSQNEQISSVNAVAFLALDIHSWLIDNLLECCVEGEIKIPSVVSVLGRCGEYPRFKQRKNNPEKDSKFLMYPLFNASGYEPATHIKGFSYLLDNDNGDKDKHPKKLYYIFEKDEDSDRSKKFIPTDFCDYSSCDTPQLLELHDK